MLSTEVSGVVQDGGDFGGPGGSLMKTGTGTLTLSGANTYSGGTTLAAGTLRLENNQALGSGRVDHDRLGGRLRQRRHHRQSDRGR